jgi:uncharacterized protein (TIGR02246 family)
LTADESDALVSSADDERNQRSALETAVTHPIDPADRAAIEAVVTRLESAWNAGDAPAFGACFAKDADFVTIRAEHFQGRTTIAGGHAVVFHTIYADSRNTLTLETVRMLRPDVAVIHVASTLDAPTGPLAGRHKAKFTAVLTKEPAGWEIASLHNALVFPFAGAPGNRPVS